LLCDHASAKCQKRGIQRLSMLDLKRNCDFLEREAAG